MLFSKLDTKCLGHFDPANISLYNTILKVAPLGCLAFNNGRRHKTPDKVLGKVESTVGRLPDREAK